jgi:hypothetical protein
MRPIYRIARDFLSNHPLWSEHRLLGALRKLPKLPPGVAPEDLPGVARTVYEKAGPGRPTEAETLGLVTAVAYAAGRYPVHPGRDMDPVERRPIVRKGLEAYRDLAEAGAVGKKPPKDYDHLNVDLMESGESDKANLVQMAYRQFPSYGAFREALRAYLREGS